MTLQQREAPVNAVSADSPGPTQENGNDDAGEEDRKEITTSDDAKGSDVNVQDSLDEVPIVQDKSADNAIDSKNVNPDEPNDATSKETDKPATPDMSVTRLIEKADHSAGKLVNLLVKHFPGFGDGANFDSRRVRFLKRAQIFVADLWAAFNGTGYGHFHDIENLTMFAGKSYATVRLVSHHGLEPQARDGLQSMICLHEI